MKNWAFVSDFDGTISKQDFYWLVIEKYFPEGRELFRQWKAAEMKDIEFLAAVFASIHQEESQIIEDIHSLPIDEYVPAFIQHVQQQGGDFYILSAGTDYYIHHIIEKYQLRNVKVFSNEGYFHEKNVHMKLVDKEHWYYSERYGIDKAKVIKQLKREYENVFYAGDSEPDSHPAVHADTTFAKDALRQILTEKGVPFVSFDSFKEIEAYLQEAGVMSK
ncbi:Haloacid Dehalogenase superfamily, subfamily IB, phosphoserine phosphatase-like/2,3-diketo-5-methylthio-1-phosphopentane phosphatase [Evansella caseinilytica]|uniref:Haloacid Dehalogenase superfamily, subfamily IB, phosphoserine phosphatase-like/2,3-diketo-5-methylthio-1-phosphopentane phosphatase n=1 Tax=Evansella caseinilytica TaxID=1503961 RepID=A0A1H3PDL8_9BACI|nr:MtnX-like HAD-IB family phosphatase [Evansella caseinilytica]SDY99161.1 Haloacid Dehalogenase superfamily, subfamily IB, phosphoserine phosphatase-like/2,3-diketo-5-methylthio-1-phosphopentane phosphatase [Evansella caseinilytica]